MDSSATLTAHLHRKPLSKHLESARKKPPLPPPPPPPPRSSRRTPSFSSSSSFFSPYNSPSSLESALYFAGGGADDPDADLSPYSPVRFSGGIPFSWEHLPGIPKKETSFQQKLFHQESSMKLLPLPPPTNNNTAINGTSYNYKKKNSLQSNFQRDPFFAAMVECSKGDEDDHEEEEDELSSRNSTGFWNSNRHGRGSNNNNKVTRSISDRFGFVNFYSSCKNASAISESIIYLPSSRRSRNNYQHFSRRRSL